MQAVRYREHATEILHTNYNFMKKQNKCMESSLSVSGVASNSTEFIMSNKKSFIMKIYFLKLHATGPAAAVGSIDFGLMSEMQTKTENQQPTKGKEPAARIAIL